MLYCMALSPCRGNLTWKLLKKHQVMMKRKQNMCVSSTKFLIFSKSRLIFIFIFIHSRSCSSSCRISGGDVSFVLGCMIAACRSPFLSLFFPAEPRSRYVRTKQDKTNASPWRQNATGDIMTSLFLFLGGRGSFFYFLHNNQMCIPCFFFKFFNSITFQCALHLPDTRGQQWPCVKAKLLRPGIFSLLTVH